MSVIIRENLKEVRNEVEVEVAFELLDPCFHRSPATAFRSFRCSNTSWHLEILSKSPENFSVTLARDDDGDFSVTISCTVGLKSSDGRKVAVHDFTKAFKKNGVARKSLFVEEPKQIWPMKKVITVFCSLRLCHSNVVVTRTEILAQDLKKLLASGKSSDVIFEVEGREFPLHQMILEVRCPEFCAIEMQDRTTANPVSIKGCKASAFQMFLEYVYCGTVENLCEENVLDLYRVARKYSVTGLKEDCLKYMGDSARSLDMFFDVLTMLELERRSDPQLMSVSSHFFSNRPQLIIQHMKWKTFMQQHPARACELSVEALTDSEKTIQY